MNAIIELKNNLEALKLNVFKDNINNYLDLITDGAKTPLDALN